MSKKVFFNILAICLFSLLHVGITLASSAREIDAEVDATLAKFQSDVEGADEYLKVAKGILVIPEVKKVGLIVGAEWGEGALRIDGKTVDYYKMKSGSYGFQAGFQKMNFVFIFTTDEALQQFRDSMGWTAGVDAGVTLKDKSAGVKGDTMKIKDPIVGFVFGKEGLKFGYSVEGNKFTKFQPE